jgi:hypothetical protein
MAQLERLEDNASGAVFASGGSGMRRSSILSLVVFLLASLKFIEAQNQTRSDQHALALAAQSISALVGGTNLSDATLTGNAIRIVGPDREMATATLIAKGLTQSRVELELSAGSRIDIRSNADGFPAGRWSNPDRSSGKYVQHNCWTDTSWFFPALSSLANFSNPGFVFSYIGKENWNGLSTLHLRVHQTLKSRDLSRLSTMDFYLDPATLLPLGLAFKTHADKDMNTDLLQQVLFADYRTVNGVQVPFHIQRLQNGGLLLDLTLASTSFNSGVPDTTFSLQ